LRSSFTPNPRRELFRAKEVWYALGISRSKFFELARTGGIPASITLGGVRYWRRRELLDWIDAGMPDRSEWRWRPSFPAKLDYLIRIRTNQLSELAREVAELESRRAAGATQVHLSQGSRS
jgi:predicted DNA-binding transcriptional regulator AlpA